MGESEGHRKRETGEEKIKRERERERKERERERGGRVDGTNQKRNRSDGGQTVEGSCLH